MKRILLLTIIILATGLNASEKANPLEDITFYSLGSYEDMYGREIGKKEAIKYIKKAKKEFFFQKAYKQLNKKIKLNRAKNEAIHPEYIKVLDNLKRSNTKYSNWVGLNLYFFVKNKYPQAKYIKRYGIYFANKNIENNYCEGYLLKGNFQGALGRTKSEQSKIWNMGIINHCKGTDFEHFHLIARKNRAEEK